MNCYLSRECVLFAGGGVSVPCHKRIKTLIMIEKNMEQSLLCHTLSSVIVYTFLKIFFPIMICKQLSVFFCTAVDHDTQINHHMTLVLLDGKSVTQVTECWFQWNVCIVTGPQGNTPTNTSGDQRGKEGKKGGSGPQSARSSIFRD